MSVGELDNRLETWERWERPALATLPYVMLAVALTVSLIVRTGPWTPDDSAVVALAALAAALLALFTLWSAVRDRPPLLAAYFITLVAVMAALVVKDPWFGFFSFTGYFIAYHLPNGKSRLLGVAACAVITGTAQSGGLPRPTAGAIAVWAVIVCINVGVVGSLFWFGWVGEEQNDRRKVLVAELSETNRRLEATLAENAGLHGQLLTQAREAGILDERQRMAREIHDTLAQGLTGIITQLQAAEQASDDPAGWRRHFAAAATLARESLSEARRSVHALRPEPLESARLGEALAGVAEGWSALHGIAVQVTTTGTVRPMPPEVEFALLRTAQEALANVARHAEATRVGVTLSYMEDEVALDVRDDGRGFDPAQRGGFGLVAMRQRIEGLSGTLQVEAEPEVGTAISACVPAAPAGARA